MFPFNSRSAWLDQSVFSRFTSCAQHAPDAIAVLEPTGRTLSYASILRQARAIAYAVDQRTEHNEAVAIAMPVGRDYISAMMGLLAAGCPYVPLDLSHPTERTRGLIAHSQARLVLTGGAGERMGWIAPDIVAIDVTNLPDAPSDWQSRSTPDSLAYIYYTSGSTGEPKGVYQNQRGLAHDVMQYVEFAELKADDTFSGLYSPSVIGSVRDIFAALLIGGKLILCDLRRDGFQTARDALQDHGATVLHAMPPVFRSMFGDGAHKMENIRLAYFAGDRFYWDDFTLVRRIVPTGCTVYTGIGCTECSTLYRHWFIPDDFSDRTGPMPVGHAIPDRQIELLDPNGIPVGNGEIGEIAVTSRFVALGYWRNLPLTEEKFTPAAGTTNERTFRTGDLGRLRSDGLLEFHGRADRLVKIRGYRVDPGETEACLRLTPGLREAAVVFIGPPLAPIMVAAIESGNEADGDRQNTLIEAAQTQVARLPTHMRPTRIQTMDALPRLANLKVDYKAVKAFFEELEIRPPHHTAPPAREEKRIPIDIEQKALAAWFGSLESENKLETFEDLGGDSIKKLKLHMLLEKKLNRRIPVTVAYPPLTFSSLCTRLANLECDLEKGVGRRKLFLFGGRNERFPRTAYLRDQLETMFDVHLLPYDKKFKGIVAQPMRDLAQACLEKLLPEIGDTAEPPPVFLGYSYGARIAYETATLYYEGHETDPATVIIGDCNFIPTVGFIRRRIKSNMLANCIEMGIAYFFSLTAQIIQRALPLFGPGWFRNRLRIGVEFGHTRLWKPTPISGIPLLILFAEKTRYFGPRLTRDLGWSAASHSVTVKSIPIGHDEILNNVGAKMAAEAIQTYFDEELEKKERQTEPNAPNPFLQDNRG